MQSRGEMAFVVPDGYSRWSGTPMPFTRLTQDANRHPPYWSPAYRSLWTQAVDNAKEMALEAQTQVFLSGPNRTRLGQNSEALLASGLPGSALRLPEVDTGLLVAVSL